MTWWVTQLLDDSANCQVLLQHWHTQMLLLLVHYLLYQKKKNSLPNTFLSSLTCEQPSLYFYFFTPPFLQYDWCPGVVERRGPFLVFSAKVGSHSGQNVSSLPEATQQNRPSSLLAPVGNNGIKRAGMQAEGEHANSTQTPSPKLRGPPCRTMWTNFIIYCSPGLSSWIWCAEFWAAGVAESKQRSKRPASHWERTRMDRIKHGYIRGTASACQMLWRWSRRGQTEVAWACLEKGHWTHLKKSQPEGIRPEKKERQKSSGVEWCNIHVRVTFCHKLTRVTVASTARKGCFVVRSSSVACFWASNVILLSGWSQTESVALTASLRKRLNANVLLASSPTINHYHDSAVRSIGVFQTRCIFNFTSKDVYYVMYECCLMVSLFIWIGWLLFPRWLTQKDFDQTHLMPTCLQVSLGHRHHHRVHFACSVQTVKETTQWSLMSRKTYIQQHTHC